LAKDNKILSLIGGTKGSWQALQRFFQHRTVKGGRLSYEL